MTNSRILPAKASSECAYDIVAMGEVMLRLDPGERRIRTARTFSTWDSGAEYNVARAFRRAFGLRAALVSAFADNEVGRLLEDILLSSGLDMSFVNWVPYDGIGETVRNGLNFSERGYGVRGALGCVDRGHTAISQLQPCDVKWDRLFGELGSRLFHTGGIMAALSEQAANTTLTAIKQAHNNNTLVSYDLNYRPSLWKARGGANIAKRVNRSIVEHVDVVVGNEEDYSVCLGIEVPGLDPDLKVIDPAAYERLAAEVSHQFPNLRAIGITLRTVHSATVNSWGALGWARGRGFAQATWRDHMEIFDRLGGGDSFASGFLYGLLMEDDLARAVELGAANGALAMTTPGDTTTATLDEIERLVSGAAARVQR